MAFIQTALGSIFLVILALSLAASVPLSNDRQSRIFAGHHAAKNQFPFLVSIRYQNKEKFVHICGASILTDRFLVTAGHCKIANSPPNDYRISVGAHFKDEQGELYKISTFITHPKFTMVPFQNLSNDIALIHLKEPIRLRENTTTIEIDHDFIESKTPAIAAGWGLSEDGYKGLKYAELNTISNDECRKVSTGPVKDFDTLCAYSGVVGTGVCSGDSGGPLISNKKLIGIASWANLCATGVPDGFTRTSEYVKWIDQVMQEQS